MGDVIMGERATPAPPIDGQAPNDSRWRRFERYVLSPNAGKRAAEKWYFCFFLASLPFQALVLSLLRYAPDTSNDALLVGQGVVLGAGAWFGSLRFRAAEDRGKPFWEVYGFKLGCYLAVWAVVGGYLGTDPWYEVLHGHFAFNTELNPNGVPLFMLPMTIAVFGFYTVVLGSLYRIGWRAIRRATGNPVAATVGRGALLVVLAGLIPLAETLLYNNANYCYDDTTGMWWLNVLVYGTWQFAALLFYPRFDEQPGENQPVGHYLVYGFATVGVLLGINQLTTEFLAPHFTTVVEGARYVNDWSVDNCLGPRPS